MPRLAHIASSTALAAVVLAAAGAGAVWHLLPDPGRPAHGMYIGGKLLGPEQDLGSWLEQRRQALAKERIRLMHGMLPYEVALGDIGVELDVGKTMKASLAPGREGSMLTQAREVLAARRGLVDIPLAFQVDERRAQVGLKDIAQAVHKHPIEAYLDLAGRRRVPSEPGEELDVEALVEDIEFGITQSQDVYALPTRLIAPQVTTDDLLDVDVSKIVTSFETPYELWGVGRARAINIVRAASSVDGTLLKPGQTFSFNETVGKRTEQSGYVLAPVIVGDELQMGTGGGICQVASTLYAAALYGALTIEERWAHGRPSSYTKMGLDATVSYPSKDLRFRNTLPYSVILHVYVLKPGVLRAEVLGGDPVAEVDYRYGIAATEPFVRRITHKPWLTPGKVVRHQKGIMGYSVVSLVKTTYGDGRVVQRAYSSEYRPAPEIFWMSPHDDVSTLPELPKGAKGVEGALADQGANGGGGA